MDISNSNSSIESTRLVIVGAGIAGLAAASTLERLNFKDYILLEGKQCNFLSFKKYFLLLDNLNCKLTHSF